MKKIYVLLLILMLPMLESCGSGGIDRSGGTYNGHNLRCGPRGGCYYINSNNNKTYVARNLCNC